jgi:predicted ester cyclase
LNNFLLIKIQGGYTMPNNAFLNASIFSLVFLMMAPEGSEAGESAVDLKSMNDPATRAAYQAKLEANKELVLQLGATNDEADWNRLDTFLTEDFRRHSRATIANPEVTSREEFKELEKMIHTTWPDRNVVYEMLVAEGDMVAAYVTFTGTHHEIGKSVEIKYLAILRIEDGRIAEIWVEWDNLDVQKQLGLLPPPVPAADNSQ